MLIKVVETTDDQYLGLEFMLPSKGDTLTLDDVEWDVEDVYFDESLGLWKIWNYNYYALVEEVQVEIKE